MLLYHYTSIDILEKILVNKTFRLTNISNLNDRSEYGYGIELLKRRTKEFEIENKISTPLNLSLFDYFMSYEDLYSVSFTENGDDLIFWNSYYVDKYSPISIGIDKDSIFDEKLIINKCIYGNPYPCMTKNRYLWFRNLFQNVLLICRSLEFIHITYQTGYIKKECFSIEREWRSISYPLKDVRQFVRNGKLCNYFDYPININSIKSIIIGPGRNQRDNMYKVKKIEKNLNLNINIQLSTIPLDL